MPMVQSRGEVAGWKLRRRVTVTDREGSSLREMGEKRVSSKALGFGKGGRWELDFSSLSSSFLKMKIKEKKRMGGKLIYGLFFLVKAGGRGLGEEEEIGYADFFFLKKKG